MTEGGGGDTALYIIETEGRRVRSVQRLWRNYREDFWPARAGEAPRAGGDPDRVSLGFRLICSAQDGARGLEHAKHHFVTEPAPQHQPV